MEKSESYEHALAGKNIPILTLDNKWYKLFKNLGEYPVILDKVKQLNDLLKRQGKLNTETKDIKALKKKLMSEIVPLVDELEQKPNKSLEKKIDENKRLIEECNEKLESYKDELMELPVSIQSTNHELMILTMEYCYDKMQSNTDEIVEIAKWITDIREELKNNLVKKQEMEYYNHQMYAYMHDIFGAEVINLFDMKYNPLEQHPQKASEKKGKKKEKGDKTIIREDEEEVKKDG